MTDKQDGWRGEVIKKLELQKLAGSGSVCHFCGCKWESIIEIVEQETKQAQIEIYERLRLKCGDYINEEWIEEELNELKNGN